MSARRIRVLSASAVALAVAAVPLSAPARGGAARAAASAPANVTLTVHADRVGPPVNRALIGFDFHGGGPPLSSVAPLQPRFVRVDASLEQVSPARGVLKLDPLLARIAEIRSVGGEPLVILDYTPAWLGQSVGPLGDPTRTEPSDLAAWRALIGQVVRALATSPAGARWFEAWNEPDLPTFWAGTQAGWLDTAAASAHAVQDVAEQSGLRLRFGGPASFFPDAAQISAFVSRLRSEGVPPAFVSWHYYANYPCLGPDGPENPSDPSSVGLQKTLGCVNPSASPTTYATGIGVVRAAVAGGFGGAAAPPLILDEWNLSAGGLDGRMTTNVGAAFDTGTLATFQAAGLDASAFYQATDTDARTGGWGSVSVDGHRRPAWFAFRLWQDLAPRTVALTGADPASGLWAVASRGGTNGRLTVLLASFSVASPTARRVEIDLAGLTAPSGSLSAVVERIDSTHPGGSPPDRLAVVAGHALLDLPAQAVALLTLEPSRSALGPSVAPPASCRTGRLLSFTIHRVGRARIVGVDVFAGRRRIAHVRARDVRRVAIRRPARTPVTLRIVDHAADGTTVTTRRLVRPCDSTRPRTRVRRRGRRRRG